MPETTPNPNNDGRSGSEPSKNCSIIIEDTERLLKSLRGERDHLKIERLVVDPSRRSAMNCRILEITTTISVLIRDVGQSAFDNNLRPAGWKYVNSDREDSTWVWVAPGYSAKTAVEGETKFYGYFALGKKWLEGRDFFKRWGGGDVQVDVAAPPSTTTTNTAIVVGSETAENHHTMDYSRLGQPTPGVPAAAGRPAESPTKETPRRQAKRGRQTTNGSSKKFQRNKRPKTKGSTAGRPKKQYPKKKGPSSNSQVQTESSPVTRVFANSPEATETPAAGNGLLRLQDPSVFVTPTTVSHQGNPNNNTSIHETSNLHGMTDALRLSEANDLIDEQKKQLEVAQNLADANALQLSETKATIIQLKQDLEGAETRADARRFEIQDLTSENSKLREEKGMEKAAFQREIEKWKVKCEQIQEEIEQLRMNHAMEQGFLDGGGGSNRQSKN